LFFPPLFVLAVAIAVAVVVTVAVRLFVLAVILSVAKDPEESDRTQTARTFQPLLS
jgi:hypothetical protein